MCGWLVGAGMGAAMMAPVGLLLAGRTAGPPLSRVLGFGAFCLMWFLVCVGASAAAEASGEPGNVASALVLAGAGAFQFTHVHADAVRACSADSHAGWTTIRHQFSMCAVACGPLMVGMIMVGTHSISMCVVAAVAMVAELHAARPTVAHVVGCLIVIVSIGVLFSGAAPVGGGVLPIHLHTATP